MGLDLTLLPFDSFPVTVIHFSHTVLNCERSEVFEFILKLKTRTVPEEFNSYLSTLENGEHGYGNTQETPYGEQLAYVYAEQLVALADTPGVQGYVKNRAAWAYLAALDPKTPVALYWN